MKNPSRHAPDRFWQRLEFYRRLEAGETDLRAAAQELGVSAACVQRWRKQYDPSRAAFAVEACPSATPAGAPTGALPGELRGEILSAMRSVALEGNVQAAKLLLTEYQPGRAEEAPGDEGLTVERAIELLRRWDQERTETGGANQLQLQASSHKLPVV